MNWRRLNNIVHCDAGYLAVGLTIVYGVSGLAVNHKADGTMNPLHLNAPKGAWTIIADVYALGLILMAITGVFVLKGRTGITGRGKWLVAAGIILPLAYWVIVASRA